MVMAMSDHLKEKLLALDYDDLLGVQKVFYALGGQGWDLTALTVEQLWRKITEAMTEMEET